jgi:O-antigen ligase
MSLIRREFCLQSPITVAPSGFIGAGVGKDFQAEKLWPLRSRLLTDKGKERDAAGWVIRVGLMVVFAFGPLAFGAVHPWAYGTVWAIICFLVALWLAKTWLDTRKSTEQWEINWVQARFNPCLVLFGLWVIIQCLPLPSALIKALQPNTLKFYHLAAPFTGDIPSTVTISLYPHATRLWTYHLWSYVAVFYLTLYHLKTRKHLMMLAVLWIALGSFQALYGITEHAGGTYHIWWWKNLYHGGVSGTFINRNHLAGYLEMKLLMALGFLLALRLGREKNSHLSWRGKLAMMARDDRWARAIPVVFCCILMGTALLLSLSRAAALTLTIFLLPTAILLLFRKPTRWYGVLGLALFIGMILYSIPLGLDSLVERFGSLREDLRGRWEIWRSTWTMAQSFPIMGTGLGTFEWVYPGFKAERFGSSIVPHAHNEWIEIWSETGIVGLFLALVGFGSYIVGGFLVWRRRRDRWAVCLGMAALAAVIVETTYSAMEFHLHTQAIGFTLAGIMGWGWVVFHHHRRGRHEEKIEWPVRSVILPRWARTWVILFLFAVQLVIGIGMGLHLLAESKAPTVRNSTVVRAEIRDLERTRRAVELEPTNATRWAWMAREVLRQGVPERLEVWALNKGLKPYGDDVDASSWAVAFLQRAIRLNPTSPSHYEQLGWVLASRDERRDDGLAEEALRTSIQLEPASPLRHFRLGQYFLLENRPEEANHAFQDAVAMNPKLQRYVDEEWAIYSGVTER